MIMHGASGSCMRKWLQKDDQGLHPNVRLPLTTEFILYGHFHRGKNGKKKTDSGWVVSSRLGEARPLTNS